MTSGLPTPGASVNQAQIWTGPQLADALRLAAEWLAAHRDHVNALNVFPVPDGDTGTNMAMTLNSAVQALGSDAHPAGEVGRLLAYGALMGARGNSGVILSQIFRGFANGIHGLDDIDGRDLARALRDAQDMAYKAVMRPVEGTMLTVIRGAADRAETSARRTSSLITVLHEAIDGAQQALDSTPQLLDILRQAGVVDAGGKGIVIILEGLKRFALGETEIEAESIVAQGVGAEMAFLDQVTDLHGEDEFGYCTNFMAFGSGIDFDRVRSDIASMGQSAVIVGDDTMVKVHIHTENPGAVLEYALRLGALDQIKIDNMSRQTEVLTEQRASAVAMEPVDADEPFEGSIAIVAVASGEGLGDALREMGATTIVRGGQTMNPSTKDILKAVDSCLADEIILLPNNKNIIMTANQIAGLTNRSVRVVPTISIPQALAALAAFNPDHSLDANAEAMSDSRSSVTTLELTKAVRDVELNGIRISNGQTIGLIDDELVASGSGVDSVARDLLTRIPEIEPELVTVFAGEDATEADVSALEDVFGAAFPEAEMEFQNGGQPHYLFIVSIE